MIKRAYSFFYIISGLMISAVFLYGEEYNKDYQAPDLLELTQKTLALVEMEKPLPELSAHLKKLAQDYRPDADNKELKALRRKIIFSHPKLDFDDLLYNRRNPRLYSHIIDHYLAKNHQPGSGLIILKNWKTSPHDSSILNGQLPEGAYFHPDLSYNGKRILFSYAPKVDPNKEVSAFQIYEIGLDGKGLKQLTGTASDPLLCREDRRTQIIENWDPCYLPGGDIVFSSSRINGQVRCAYGMRYNPTFGLCKMSGDGLNIRQLTFGDISEYDPVVGNDGRIVYCRWDYVDRRDAIFHGLWSIHPDGTKTSHYYGNYTKSPSVITQAKPIPGSNKMIALATAHHYQFLGSVIRLDVQKGEDGLAPITRLTPDVGFPETEIDKKLGRYATPWPITEDIFLVSYLEDNKHLAIYLADSLGGRELIHRVKGESCYSPIPLRSRTAPPPLPDLVAGNLDKNTGIFSISNVYESRHNIKAAGIVKYLRVNKIYDQVAQISPAPHYVGNAMPVKILGEVPVNPDGSVTFKAPAKEMLQLQLLDEDRKCIMGMRTFIYLQPGEISSCVGCHENRNTAPPMSLSRNMEIHTLTPPQDSNYSGGFSFPKTIQPILDRKCISCHGLDKNKNKLDLIGHPASVFAQRQYGAPGMKLIWLPQSHLLLSSYAKIDDSNKQPYNSIPGKYHSPEAKLLPILEKHHNLELSKDELTSFIRWLDLGGVCHGDWSWNRPYMRSFNPEGVTRLRQEISRQFGDELAKQPTPALINTSAIQQSRILKMPMPTSHGGWGQTAKQWSGPQDPDYLKILELVDKAVVPTPYIDKQGTCGRGTAKGCICGSCWVREYYDGDRSVLKVANPYRQLNPDMTGHDAVPDSKLFERHGREWKEQAASIRPSPKL